MAFIGIVSTSTDYSSLRLVQFFAENDILIGIGSSLLVDLLLVQLFGSVLDRVVLRENIYLTRIFCDLSHLELCRVHWNCVHIYGLFKLTSSPILRGEQYSNRDWFLFTCGFVAHSVVWERLDRFALGENVGLRVRISCYLTLHHACCFARIVLHVQPLRSV